MKGGLAPKRKGDAFEVRVKADQERQGLRCERLRQGQGNLWDMVAWSPCEDQVRCSLFGRLNHMFLVQARLRGNLTKAEREVLVKDAALVRCVPVLAFESEGQVQYRRLDT